jgi:hypothetical protein
MRKPTMPGKAKNLIARVVLCVLGIFFLYISIYFLTTDAAPTYHVWLVILGIGGIALALYQLYLSFFGSEHAVVQFLAFMMESE